MKKIGFLFGDEVSFSNDIIEFINLKNNLDIIAEEIKIGIFNFENSLDYAVIFDRFSNKVPFYKTVLKFLNNKGIKIINYSDVPFFADKFVFLSELKKLKINIPKTAIIPNKSLPVGIDDTMLRNLIYPLDWEETFKYIGFPAYILPNKLYDNFYNYVKVYNSQEFYSVYDNSDDNVLLLQQTFEYDKHFRVLVVGDEKFIIGYNFFKPVKDRYYLIDEVIEQSLQKQINSNIKLIKKHYNIDMFFVDFGIKDKLYMLNSNIIQNVDYSYFPDECYKWLVKTTANFLIKCVETPVVKKIVNKNTKKN